MKDKLREYKKKRDFKKSDEPRGDKITKNSQLSFCVQRHAARREHYDFRLEWDGVLLSWAVPKGPSYDPADKRLAIKVEDHPLEYASFEGTIPKGQYGGGTVMLWDRGSWQPIGDVEKGLQKGVLKFTLNGERLFGNWTLVRLKEEKDKDNWLLIKEKDEYALSHIDFSRSVRTGLTMAEIAEETPNFFGFTAEPQLLTISETPPKGDDWIFEPKYDGYRIIAYLSDGEVKLISRNGIDLTQKFVKIASGLGDFCLGKSAILDGEIISPNNDGISDFSKLQKSESGREVYVVFDMLYLSGEDLRTLPLYKRKEKLAEFLLNAPDSVYYVRHIQGCGEEFYEAAKKTGLEGIVCKKIDSVYSGRRNGDWIKIKFKNSQEFVVGGYVAYDDSPKISSLLIGYFDDEKLVYCGNVGSGFSQSERREIYSLLLASKTDESPFYTNNTKKESNYVLPLLAVQVEFSEWTKDGRLRHPVFKGIRTDKDVREIGKDNEKNEE